MFPSHDHRTIIDMAFDFSERYPDAYVDIEFTDDGITYFSLLNGRIAPS